MTPTRPAPLLHSAFYRFVPLAEPVAAAEAVRRLAQGLQGSIVLAAEGINGTLAGAPEAVRSFEQAVQQPAVAGGAFAGITFKHSACVTAPFGRLKVSVKPQTVALDLPALASDRPLAPPSADTHDNPGAHDAHGAHGTHGAHAAHDLHAASQDASHLSPLAWRALLARSDRVLLDNRNHFEYRLGHFVGAVDPQVHNFRDFVAYVQAEAPAWRAAGRPVAMYCTGGIRCDKTAPWLRSLGLEVWQLDGGILNYFAQLDDAHREWQGECFVFDKRIALDSHLQETACTADQVFDVRHPDEAWRLQRAVRLDGTPKPGLAATPQPGLAASPAPCLDTTEAGPLK